MSCLQIYVNIIEFLRDLRISAGVSQSVSYLSGTELPIGAKNITYQNFRALRAREILAPAEGFGGPSAHNVGLRPCCWAFGPCSWQGTNIIQLFSGGVRTCRTDGQLAGYEHVLLTDIWRGTNITHTQLYIYRYDIQDANIIHPKYFLKHINSGQKEKMVFFSGI